MIKKAAILVFTFFLFGSCLVSSVSAAPEVQKEILPTSPIYFLVKAKESIQQFFTFSETSKTKLLENFADRRVREMNYASLSNDDSALNSSLNRYTVQKTQSLEYAENSNDQVIIEEVKGKTLGQQKEMTKIQLTLENSSILQENVVEVQKEVANQIKNTVQVVQGTEKAVEMDMQTHFVWLDPNIDASGNLPPLPDELDKWEYAPGTEGRDGTGRVVETTLSPGTEGESGEGEKVTIEWAPGTEGSGNGKVIIEGDQKIEETLPDIKVTNGAKKVIKIEKGPNTDINGNPTPNPSPAKSGNPD